MKICVAQTKPISGDIEGNIQNHLKWIERSINEKNDFIVFPELSLTGFEPSLAKDLATHQNDSRLDPFQEISDQKVISIGLGLPTKSPNGICISMIIFQPNAPRITYSKQKLHTDEIPYFVEGEEQIVLEMKRLKIAPAICYESMLDEHSKHAFNMGANLYMTSSAKSKSGVDKAYVHYPKIAKKYEMLVFMSNAVGACDDFESAGRSSIWDENGILVGQLDEGSEGLLIYDVETREVAKLD